WRGTVDLVREEDVGEDRPLLELEVLPAVRVLHDDVRADDVGGHQVRGELDPRERQLETFRERLDEERLAEAGHALEQDVTAGKHARQDVGDDLAVADDHLLDLRPQRLECGDERFHPSVLTHSGLLSRTITPTRPLKTPNHPSGFPAKPLKLAATSPDVDTECRQERSQRVLGVWRSEEHTSELQSRS